MFSFTSVASRTSAVFRGDQPVALEAVERDLRPRFLSIDERSVEKVGFDRQGESVAAMGVRRGGFDRSARRFLLRYSVLTFSRAVCCESSE